MLKIIKRIINKVRTNTRDISTGGKRSSKWPSVEKAFKLKNPTCAACGGTEKIQVHHKHPFHLFPAFELDPTNLISLCMGPNECHLFIGHGDNFKAWNPNVELDAEKSLTHPKERHIIAENAKKTRIFGEG